MNFLETLETRLNNIECLLLDIKHSNAKSPPSQIVDRCSTDEAIQFLKEQGYPLSGSTLYKLTATNEIPVERFGSKLIFSRKDLLNWVEARTIGKEEDDTSLTLARNARKRKGGTIA